MTIRKGNCSSLRITTMASALVLSLPLLVAAQSAADTDTDSDDTVEEIVVTGSRLVRRDFTAPSPIQTVDRQMLAFAGQQTLEATLNRLPQLTPDFDRQE